MTDSAWHVDSQLQGERPCHLMHHEKITPPLPTWTIQVLCASVHILKAEVMRQTQTLTADAVNKQSLAESIH